MADDKSPPIKEDTDKKSEPKEERLLAGKYKNKEELEKGYQELADKLTEQGSELGEARKQLLSARDYQMYTAPVVKLLEDDEGVRKTVFEKLGAVEPTTPQASVDTPDAIAQVARTEARRESAEVRLFQEKGVYADFEAKYGIDKLSDSDRKEARAKVGAYLGKWAPRGVKNIPLHLLGGYLEDAYLLANKDVIKEQGKAEGRVQQRAAEAGAIGSIPSGEASAPKKTELTPAQKAIAKKAKISEEDYAAQLNEIEAEYDVSD